MRFHRFEAYRPYEVTPRKLSALARRQRAEREALPLFAEQIAAEQPSAAEVMAQRSTQWTRAFRRDRDRAAEQWRRGRRELRALPSAAHMVSYWREEWRADALSADAAGF
jgi:hypothetical protein